MIKHHSDSEQTLENSKTDDKLFQILELPTPVSQPLAKFHLVGFRELPDLRNSISTSKTKTLCKIWKINKPWRHFSSLLSEFVTQKSRSCFGHPGANEFSPGEKSLSHEGCDTGVELLESVSAMYEKERRTCFRIQCKNRRT